ncbi:unnamed protein product [Nippostrongylus brasiliensis]|uniref:Uncharacterized protein n=1 Tax=Nippostrongylus brasiliensis TaxID=27835 RepID=A0A0N4XZV1_NIPBR|nr:unnamed protein product [Nippostrongylus brasiliensis]
MHQPSTSRPESKPCLSMPLGVQDATCVKTSRVRLGLIESYLSSPSCSYVAVIPPGLSASATWRPTVLPWSVFMRSVWRPHLPGVDGTMSGELASPDRSEPPYVAYVGACRDLRFLCASTPFSVMPRFRFPCLQARFFSISRENSRHEELR